MSSINEIEKAVNSLSEKEYTAFRQWFLDRDWKKWDKQIEVDINNGKLDFLINEAADSDEFNTFKNI